MSQSQIQRMNAPINQVNDSVIGGQPAFGNSSTVSKVAGQLGMSIILDDTNVFANTSVGTVYGGRFQYVRLAAAATSNPAVGQIVFWDPTSAPGNYQVTTLESGTTPGALLVAGVNLTSVWTAGNYSFIQTIGLVYVKFRAVLTAAPTGVGVSVYAAGAGAGADNGLADCYNTADPATYGDVAIFQDRYLGASYDLPVAASLKRVYLNPKHLRG